MIKLLRLMIATFAVLFGLSPLSHAGTVEIIAEDDWHPYSGQTKDGVAGIAVDIVREAFRAEGFDVKFVSMNYDRAMLLVKDGKAIGGFDTPRTKEVEETYYWHDKPMFLGESLFFATADYTGKINGVKDLKGKTLGLTQGYGYGDAIDTDATIHKEYSKSDEVIIKKLIAKRVDYIVLYNKVADYLISKLNIHGQIKPVGASETAPLYVAFSKKHPEGKRYRDIFSKGFDKINANGTYKKIFSEWDAKFKAKVQSAAPKHKGGEGPK